MQQGGGQNSGRTRSVAAFVGRLVFAAAVLFYSPGRLFAGELLKSPSAFDDFGKFDESKAEKWKELESPLPAWPEDARLIPVRMPVAYTLKVYIDEKSVSRLADGIARFTLVAESPSGVRNVFFEGYNCETREYKTYATGTPDKTFEPVKKPKWERAPYYDVNAFRFQLLRNYVCDPDALSLALRPQDLVRRLKDATSE
jgi:hypothetical protein